MEGIRRGHVASAPEGRLKKAEKIEALLAPYLDIAGADVLDLGAGSGLLSAYFAPRVKTLVAADRDTSPFEPEGIEIVETRGSDLPFDDNRFDLVIWNHVIEHVGDRATQATAAREIRRVLRPGGVLYCAVPNRLTLIEPHYKLPFLSWLPQPLADRWVRASGKGTWYDCNPFRAPELVRLLTDAGFGVEDSTRAAFYALLRIEKANSALGRALARLPAPLVDALHPLMPTFVMICRA